jgi:hypothetical protein
VLNVYWFGSFVRVLYDKMFVHGGYVVATEGDVGENGAKKRVKAD